MFISCSDDETVKIWGVKDKIKIEMNNQNSKDIVKKVDVRNEV